MALPHGPRVIALAAALVAVLGITTACEPPPPPPPPPPVGYDWPSVATPPAPEHRDVMLFGDSLMGNTFSMLPRCSRSTASTRASWTST